MSEEVRIAAPVRERRSHAERRAETRMRILAAVVESIDDVGFQRTTGSEIARRAGVSWGAVQHHFRDKDGILVAVLERSFALFKERLEGAIDPEADLGERVDLFVERAWSHFSSPEYRSTFEILRNLPDDLDRTWQADLLSQWLEVWSRYFPESPIAASPAARGPAIELLYFTFSTLSGLASARMFDAAGGRLEASGLALLKATLERAFREGRTGS
jgi:AcrR family transcriptional regulator